MSRSRKHTPIVKDNSRCSKKAKRAANRKVRRSNIDDLPQKGCGYKKYYCQYDIHDFISYWTWEAALTWYRTTSDSYIKKKFPTEKEFYVHWYKDMIAK